MKLSRIIVYLEPFMFIAGGFTLFFLIVNLNGAKIISINLDKASNLSDFFCLKINSFLNLCNNQLHIIFCVYIEKGIK